MYKFELKNKTTVIDQQTNCKILIKQTKISPEITKIYSLVKILKIYSEG